MSQLPSFGSGVPHAYLRLLVYKADSTVLADRIVPVSAAARTSWEAVVLPQFVLPTGAAYAQLYLANESNVAVWFDDLKIEHWQGLQVQENHYDPFGLELAGLARSTPGLRTLNQYQWSGKEKQSDFGLGWTNLDWRFFDPQTGRFHTVDPLSDAGQEMWSTYQFGFDNAIRYNDPDGRNPDGGDEPPSVGASLLSFALGAAVAYIDNNTGANFRGSFRNIEDPVAFNAGQDAGDKASMVSAMAEITGGEGAEVGGIVIAPETAGLSLAASGAGALAAAHGGFALARAGSSFASQKGRLAEPSPKNNNGRVYAKSATSGENPAAARGRQAHKDYNPGKGYVTDPSKNRLQNGKIPDAIHPTKRIVRELKPNNPKAIKRGENQVKKYAEQLEKETGKKWTWKVDTY